MNSFTAFSHFRHPVLRQAKHIVKQRRSIQRFFLTRWQRSDTLVQKSVHKHTVQRKGKDQ